MSGENNIKEVALKRVRRLFNLAITMLHERPDLSQRYIEVARRIAMRVRIRLPREMRFLICRHCKKFIFPGIGSRIRIQSRREPHIVITCLYCGKQMRRPLRRKN